MVRKLACSVVLLMVFAGCGGVAPTASATSLNGNWKSSDPKMSAHISNHTISVYWETSAVSQLYWKGTLPSSIAQGKATSIGDTKAMATELLASESTHKGFVYKNGKISFTLSIAGLSTVVYLTK